MRRSSVLALPIAAALALAGCATQPPAVCNLPAMEPPNMMLYPAAFLRAHPAGQLTVKVDGATVKTLVEKQVRNRQSILIVVGAATDEAVTPSPKPIDLEIEAAVTGRAVRRTTKIVSLHNAWKALHGACAATLWTATVRLGAGGDIR